MGLCSPPLQDMDGVESPCYFNMMRVIDPDYAEVVFFGTIHTLM
jgi:hypothetical protein